MSEQQHTSILPSGVSTPSIDNGKHGLADGLDDKHPPKDTATVANLAATETQRMEAALGDWLLRKFRIRKGPRTVVYDLDAVCARVRTINYYMGADFTTGRYSTKCMGQWKP